MKKKYQKPEVELISLLVPEHIAVVIDPVGDAEFDDDGELGLESSIFN